MFEEDREKFWRVFLAENRRMKINIRNLAKAVGYSPSTVDKFKRKCAGSDDLLEKISIHVFRKHWRELIAEQNAEQNGRQDAENGAEDEKVSNYVKSLEKRIDALQMLIEQHIKAHPQQSCEEVKKTG